MPVLDAGQLWAALVTGALAGLLALVAPRLLALVPEPEPEPQPEPVPEPQPEPEPHDHAHDEADHPVFARTLPPPPPKTPYAEIAAARGFRVGVPLSSLVAGALVGGAAGWGGALIFLTPLVPVCVVLLVVDWRTTLLPTRIIHPTYALLAVTIPLAAFVDGDLDSLYRAGWGWLIVGGWFWVFWFLLHAWGFGDVRLARVLGPALGYLGWSELIGGLFAMILLGGIGGAVLAIADRSVRRRYPYGPFMVVGAGLAAVAGPWMAAGLGY